MVYITLELFKTSQITAKVSFQSHGQSQKIIEWKIQSCWTPDE
jgi:hypothetical protein